MALRRPRRGSYALTLGASVTVLLGFAALALDVAWVLRARADAQAIADAAAHAAVVTLRRTGDPGRAAEAADLVAMRNVVAGAPARLLAVELGTWDDTVPSPAFAPGGAPPNAARVRVGRVGDEAVVAWLARVAGVSSFGVAAEAVAATRSVTVAVALDLDPSWPEADFLDVRDALVVLAERLGHAPAPGDVVLLSAHASRFAWLVTPPTAPALDPDGLADAWAALRPASRAGTNTDPSDGLDCAPDAGDDFEDPPGGCYPDSPRAWSDEQGVDPAAALRQVEAALAADDGVPAYRAVLVLTGHLPADVPATAGAARDAAGFTEARFAGASTPAGRDATTIAADASDAAADLWEGPRAHVWAVGVGVDDPWLAGLAHGDGQVATPVDAAELAARVARLADTLPVGVVR